MTNTTLAQSYLIKASKRLKSLAVLLDQQAYSDVIREAQEIVELASKGMLRQVGIEPPKWHDVGDPLLQFGERFPLPTHSHLERLAATSAWLRKGGGSSYSTEMCISFPLRNTLLMMGFGLLKMPSPSWR